jgi:hypothetical protein
LLIDSISAMVFIHGSLLIEFNDSIAVIEALACSRVVTLRRSRDRSASVRAVLSTPIDGAVTSPAWSGGRLALQAEELSLGTSASVLGGRFLSFNRSPFPSPSSGMGGLNVGDSKPFLPVTNWQEGEGFW